MVISFGSIVPGACRACDTVSMKFEYEITDTEARMRLHLADGKTYLACTYTVPKGFASQTEVDALLRVVASMLDFQERVG